MALPVVDQVLPASWALRSSQPRSRSFQNPVVHNSLSTGYEVLRTEYTVLTFERDQQSIIDCLPDHNLHIPVWPECNIESTL